MTHVMIDLETMGNAPTAAITSIGAVLFDPHGDWIGDAFHVHVSLESCLFYKLTMDASTVLWWLGQSEAARKTLVDGQPSASSLIEALNSLTSFMPVGVTPWCNGASFDFAILSHAYRAIGKPSPPWEFWKERDLRTLKGLNPDMKIVRDGIHHNALDDARYQARLVQHILQANPDLDS